MKNSKFVMHGIAAAIALTMVYVIIVTAAQGFSHALATFFQLWYLMVPLVAGFGVQAGLFSYVHSLKSVSSKTIATSGGVSTVSMVACCAHHLTDVLPLLGLTALSIFLTQYQSFFIALGIFSNAVGITFMLGIIQSKRLYAKKSMLSSLFKYDIKKIRNAAITISVPILVLMFLLLSMPAEMPQAKITMLQEITNSENGLTIVATPKDFRPGSPVRFDIKFDTHQGSLDFDVAEVSALEDSNGAVYSALSWKGFASGGHHREGILAFPRLSGNPASMELIIKNVYGIRKRTFSWELG